MSPLAAKALIVTCDAVSVKIGKTGSTSDGGIAGAREDSGL